MVAHEVAVVSGKDQHRIFRQSRGLECRAHLADRIVNQGNHAVSQRSRFAGLPFVDRIGQRTGSVRLAPRETLTHVAQHR